MQVTIRTLSDLSAAKVLFSVDLVDYLDGLMSDDVIAIATQLQALHDNFTNLSGDLWWIEIATALKAALGTQTELGVNYLAKLDDSLLMKTMAASAIELIKNSIDAFIEHYKQQVTDNVATERNTTLDILFELSINLEADQVSLVIQDNAGGFSEAYASELNAIMTLDALQVPYHSTKNQQSNKIYLGGEGLGMQQLIALIRFGYTRSPNKKIGPLYDWTDNPKTLIQFDNARDPQGARILIQTPLRLIPISVHSESTMTTVESDDEGDETEASDSEEANNSGKRNHFFDLPSAKKQLNRTASVQTIYSEEEEDEEEGENTLQLTGLGTAVSLV